MFSESLKIKNMNLNTIGYIIYLIINISFIIVIGKICYHNGNRYVSELIPNNQELCIQLNKILLIAYYLLNIGYCTTTLIYWNHIVTVVELIEIIASKTSIIIAVLGILHYSNIFIITNYLKKINL